MNSVRMIQSTAAPRIGPSKLSGPPTSTVAVRMAGGDPVAAVSLAVHRSMMSMDDLIARLGPALRMTAEEISRRIGHRSPVR